MEEDISDDEIREEISMIFDVATHSKYIQKIYARSVVPRLYCR
jgi:hypothetical protein